MLFSSGARDATEGESGEERVEGRVGGRHVRVMESEWNSGGGRGEHSGWLSMIECVCTAARM